MSLLDQILGRAQVDDALSETTTTSDVAPVAATVPSWRQARRRRTEMTEREKKEDEQRRSRSRLVAGVIGATFEDTEDEHERNQSKDSLIPDGAREVDVNGFDASGLSLKTPKEKKDDPDDPQDEAEKLLTPRAALVAPDVTPNSMTEIDPADVPGSSAPTFKASDVVNDQSISDQQPMASDTGADRFTTAMDALLGKSRSAPATNASPVPNPEFESRSTSTQRPVYEQRQSGISPEAAAAAFTAHITPSSGPVDLTPGKPMPEHQAGDGRTVFENARRWG